MQNIRDIKDRIKSAKEIRKITRAMKLVATAKYKKSQRCLEETLQYVTQVHGLTLRVKQEVICRYNPFFVQPKENGKELLVLITADKGLCGGFNANLIRETIKTLGNRDLFVIGKKGRMFFRRHKDANLIGEVGDIFGKLGFKDARRIMNSIKKDFLLHKYSTVSVRYMHFESLGIQRIVTEQLLPVIPFFETETDQTELKKNRLIWEASPESVFDRLVDHYIDLQIFRMLLESELSEHITRMNAMESATNNASDLINQLTLDFNRARQAMITTEILEITGGAEALNK